MAVTRAQKVRLGVFVLVSGTLLVVSLVILTGLQLVQKRDAYTVVIADSVSGLETGAQVKYNGVRVGTVDGIRIDPEDVSKVIISLSLDAGTPIKADTRAVLQSAGITGLKFVELLRGSPKSELLEPGAQITAGESFLDRISGQAEVIAQKAEMGLNSLNALLNEENRGYVTGILGNVEDLTASAAELVDENRESLRVVAQSLAELSTSLDSRVASLEAESVSTLAAVRNAADALGAAVDQDKVGRILSNVERMTADLRSKVHAADIDGLIRQVNALSTSAEQLVGNVNLVVMKSREDLYASLNYLLEGLENFSEFARMLRENPSLLLRGPDEEERAQ